MDDSSNKRLLPQNRVHPKEVVIEVARLKGGPESEVPHVNQI